MMGRICRIATVVALSAGAVTLAAAERATFILTDGDRVSGEVVFHTEERTNIRADKNEFNLKVASGEERAIPFDHVVYIDFVGGQPRPEELSALPQSGHLLTLRNGDSRTGRLVDMIGGTVVRWERDGQRSDIPINDVRRIYLRIDRVRELYNVPASAPPQASTAPEQAQPGRSPIRALTTVTVRGGSEWTDTGLNVRPGQPLRFEASGQVFIARSNDSAAGPGGVSDPGAQFPVPSLPAGALIGKVGPNGRPFAIGASTAEITMPAVGRLFLGINDSEFDDNSGSFRVVIGR